MGVFRRRVGSTVLMKSICLLLLVAIVIVVAEIPALTITRDNVFAAGDLDVVYNVDVCVDDTLTNWTFATNIIGNGTNNPPEWIDLVITNGSKFYRINPE